MKRLVTGSAFMFALSALAAGCGGSSGSRHGSRPVYGPGSTGHIAANGSASTGGGGSSSGGGGGGGGGTVGNFAAGPALLKGRMDHTATTLVDGRVLVTAGASANGIYQNSEVFDPTTNTWTDSTKLTATQNDGLMIAGTFTTARYGHTATLLSNGSVLIAGGIGAERNNAQGQPVSEALKTAFLFNPTQNKFVPIASLNTNRGYHLATLLANNKALVVAGINQTAAGTHANGEVYDVQANTWTQVSTGAHHTYGTIVTTTQTVVSLVVGGCQLARNQQGQLAPTQPLPSPRTEKFDPAAGQFTAGPNNAGHRLFQASNRISTGGALFVGGIDLGGQGVVTDTTELFDPAASTFTPGPKLTVARQSAEVAEIKTSSDQLIVGGIDGQGQAVKKCEVYSHYNKTIIGTTDMSTARYSHRAVTLNDGRVLVIGGTPDGQQVLDSCEIHTR